MKFVIAVTGASGALYAIRLLNFLSTTPHHIELAVSPNAVEIAKDECNFDYYQTDLPIYGPKDFNAAFASGSAHFDAMAIVPCSMGTLGRIAHGYSESLVTRAADVFLKEKRPLILVPRETPLNLVHIENMRLLAQAGATIIPAIPSFYSKPGTIEEAVDTVVARILDQMGVENELRPRYGNHPED